MSWLLPCPKCHLAAFTQQRDLERLQAQCPGRPAPFEPPDGADGDTWESRTSDFDDATDRRRFKEGAE